MFENFETSVIPLSLASATVICLALALVATLYLAIRALSAARAMARSKSESVREAARGARRRAIWAIPTAFLFLPVGLGLARSAAKRSAHASFGEEQVPNPAYTALSPSERALARREGTALPPKTVLEAPDLSFPDRSRSSAAVVALVSLIASVASAMAAAYTLVVLAPTLIVTLARLAGVGLPAPLADVAEVAELAQMAGVEGMAPEETADIPDASSVISEDGTVDRDALYAYLEAVGISPEPLEALDDETFQNAAQTYLDLITESEPENLPEDASGPTSQPTLEPADEATQTPDRSRPERE